MSHVTLLAAGRPLPLHPADEAMPGFAVEENSYYRSAVEAMGLTMLPCCYEVMLEPIGSAAEPLRRYLAKQLQEGETAELWALWVHDEAGKVCRYRGRLADLDADTLMQLRAEPLRQVCLTIER